MLQQQTNAILERVFPALTRDKTSILSTMTNSRLNHLLIARFFSIFPFNTLWNYQKILSFLNDFMEYEKKKKIGKKWFNVTTRGLPWRMYEIQRWFLNPSLALYTNVPIWAIPSPHVQNLRNCFCQLTPPQSLNSKCL